MADAEAVLELLDREKLGHLGFRSNAQPDRGAVGLLDLEGNREERSDSQQLRLQSYALNISSICVYEFFAVSSVKA